MMVGHSLSVLGIVNNPAGKTAAESFTTNPTLTNPNDDSFFIELFVENHEQTASAEVSESLIISTSTDSKKYISDSVAPGPWEWSLEAYIKADEAELIAGCYQSLKTKIERLKKVYEDGTRLTYKDIDCSEYEDVVIQQLSISFDSENANVRKVSLQLKKINIQEAESSDLTVDEYNATPASGTSDGETQESGLVTEDDEESNVTPERLWLEEHSNITADTPTKYANQK